MKLLREVLKAAGEVVLIASGVRLGLALHKRDEAKHQLEALRRELQGWGAAMKSQTGG